MIAFWRVRIAYHSPIHHFEQQFSECFLDSPWSSAGLTQKTHDFIA